MKKKAVKRMKRGKTHGKTPAKKGGASGIVAAKAAAQREYDRFMSLSDAEKTRAAEQAAAAAERGEDRPLMPAERALFDELGIGAPGRPSGPRRRGRPMRGQGARQISLTVERHLLSRADHYARQHGMSRAQLVARGWSW